MKKLVFGLMAISMISALSIGALEKPATADDDIDIVRIKQILGESTKGTPQASTLEQLKALLAEIKEKAKVKTTEELEKLNRLMTDLEAAIKAKVK